jgi:hypothetical protein
MRDGAHPAAPQGVTSLLFSDPDADVATLLPPTPDMGSLGPDIVEMSEEDELLLRTLNAANAEEPVIASPPAQEQRILQPHHSVIAGDNIQEGFLPAGNPDVGPQSSEKRSSFLQTTGLKSQMARAMFQVL